MTKIIVEKVESQTVNGNVVFKIRKDTPSYKINDDTCTHEISEEMDLEVPVSVIRELIEKFK